MYGRWENLPTRETIEDTVVHAEFDVYFDQARDLGYDVREAGLIAGALIMQAETFENIAAVGDL